MSDSSASNRLAAVAPAEHPKSLSDCNLHNVDEPANTISLRDVSDAIEFSCWITVALIPVLRWINGAAVTRDQLFMQIGLGILVIIAALGLRIYNGRFVRRKE